MSENTLISLTNTAVDYENKNMVINFIPETKEPYYCRSTSDQCNKLCSLLTTLYKCQYTILTPSGTAAITTVLETLASKFNKQKKKINLIISDELYSDTPRICRNFCDKWGIMCNIILHQVDVSNSAQVINKFKEVTNDNNIFFIESCTNPCGKVIDYEIIADIKKIASSTIVVVDNTWLSHVILNPFTIENNVGSLIDLVVLSLTKYYSAGQVIGGAILANFNSIPFTDMIVWPKYCGYHVSPYNAKIIIGNIMEETQEPTNLNNNLIVSRLKQSYKNTLIAIEHIKTIPDFFDLKYSLLDYHPSCTIARKYFNKEIGPSIIVIHTNANINTVKKALKNLTIIKPVTSYGHAFTSLCNYVKVITIPQFESQVTDQGLSKPKSKLISEKRAPNKKIVRLRLSFGYADTPENIINGINELSTLLKN